MKNLFLCFLLSLAGTNLYAQSRCYILGDSIAQGVASYSNQCASATKVGLNTNDARKYFATKGPLYFDNLVISLGINDKGQPQKTMENLVAIRMNVKAKKVIWVLPNSYHAQEGQIVKRIATYYGDSFVDVTPVIGSDRIHPTPEGYKIIANTLSTQYRY